MRPSPVSVAGVGIGPGHPPALIAELSGNHNGSIDRALALVDAAAAAGAAFVKLQTYTADTLTIDHDGPGFRLEGGLWSGRTLHDLYREASTPWEWHAALFDRGRAAGVPVFSSPFDDTAVALLEELGCPAYKIASPELVDVGLVRTVASTGKPLVISTGMGTTDEIDLAVTTAREAGSGEIVLLHCTSAYPAAPEDARLANMAALEDRYGVPTGLSDHTEGTAVSIAAAALGAAAIERHVTLARADGGVDSAFSLEPSELAALVTGARAAAVATGEVSIGPVPAEAATVALRRSLYVVADVRAGEAFTRDNVRSIRPAHGLPPRELDVVLGRTASRDLRRGEPLDWSMVANA
jgi:pseudaminic acid synthase